LCHYQLAARAEQGDRVTKLQALAFHVCRALAHKPVEARILLHGLLSTEATHPKVALTLTL
jgi:hypothetical protein